MIKYPDYKNCIAGIPNSILKNMGLEQGRGTLSLLDKYLDGKDYENIVVILLDGMGKNIMDGNLARKGFFQTHLAGTFSSTFPPTTVAATTSILSGMEPCEHGWLGWDCYYPQIDKNVTVFLNKETGTDEQAENYNVASRYCGYESAVDRLVKSGRQGYMATPFAEPFPASFEKICDRIEKLCGQPGKKYIYSYWSEPDHTMHGKGCFCGETKELLRKLEKQVKELCKKLGEPKILEKEELSNKEFSNKELSDKVFQIEDKDVAVNCEKEKCELEVNKAADKKRTLVIVTADHGHMDTKGVALTDYPGICECLSRLPSIEPRALNFFIKPGMEEQFVNEFKRKFSEKYMLLTKAEVLEKKLFGEGAEHPAFRDMLGDYLAVAIGDLCIYNTRKEADFFIGAHAGLTEEEMTIPLILIEC